MKILPDSLNKGDTIGIIATSGVIKNPDMLDRAIENIQSRGYKVKLAPNIKSKKWYLAGSDDERLQGLMGFFKDPEVKAIFCARGGYGCTRLLDKIDYNIIRDNPKILLGYSDITALHFAFNKYANLITFHGPLTASDFGKKQPDEFTWNNTWSVLEGDVTTPFELPNYHQPVCINPGKATGEIIGGNMAMISSLLGTKYSLDFSNKVLFLEDVSENKYRLDRYLTHLKIAGVFEQVNGIIFGEYTDIVKSDDSEVNQLEIIDIIRDIIADLKIPAMYGFSCGHGIHKSTLPFGAACELNCNDGILKIVESFVKTSKIY